MIFYKAIQKKELYTLSLKIRDTDSNNKAILLFITIFSFSLVSCVLTIFLKSEILLIFVLFDLKTTHMMCDQVSSVLFFSNFSNSVLEHGNE